MASVNLYSAQQQSQQIENKRKAPLGTFFFSLGIVVLSLGVYGGVRFWEKQVDAKIAVTESRMAVVQQELLVSSQESNEIHDIYLRLSNIQKDISAPVLPSLAGIEKNILKGVVLSQYEYGGLESSDVILTGDAVDANTLLQQVERFQSSGVFSSVQLKSVGFSEQGYLLFTLQMSFANQNKK